MSQFAPAEAPLALFEEISRIPRPSGKEQRISNYVKAWAEARGLDVYQDSSYNLIILKGASPGCEGCAPVILQAHMDMVCEKDSGSAHNFDTDPILLQAEGDWLRSACGTTLGADDGIGVAYCMAVLADNALVHPPIEVLLTVEEESTFFGAATVDWSLLRGTRLINLDFGVEKSVLCGSCGGSGVEVTLPLEREAAPAGWSAIHLTLRGLMGGHSGEDINKGRGSAIQLMTRALRRCCQDCGARLVSFSGGSYRLAISREAEATVLVPPEETVACLLLISRLNRTFQAEYEAATSELRLQGEASSVTADTCCTEDACRRALLLLSLLPDGVQKMNGAFPGVVESSNNLGTVRMEEGLLRLTAEIRGAYASTVADLQEKIALLAQSAGGECRFHDVYYSWTYHDASPLRAAASDCYERLYGAPLTPVVVHAGIECGFFLHARPNLDAIALGPNAERFHSPQERLSISSTLRVWEFLKALLRDLARE